MVKPVVSVETLNKQVRGSLRTEQRENSLKVMTHFTDRVVSKRTRRIRGVQGCKVIKTNISYS